MATDRMILANRDLPVLLKDAHRDLAGHDDLAGLLRAALVAEPPLLVLRFDSLPVEHQTIEALHPAVVVGLVGAPLPERGVARAPHQLGLLDVIERLLLLRAAHVDPLRHLLRPDRPETVRPLAGVPLELEQDPQMLEHLRGLGYID